jgi:hypothetical protein
MKPYYIIILGLIILGYFKGLDPWINYYNTYINIPSTKSIKSKKPDNSVNSNIINLDKLYNESDKSKIIKKVNKLLTKFNDKQLASFERVYLVTPDYWTKDTIAQIKILPNDKYVILLSRFELHDLEKDLYHEMVHIIHLNNLALWENKYESSWNDINTNLPDAWVSSYAKSGEGNLEDIAETGSYYLSDIPPESPAIRKKYKLFKNFLNEIR